MSFVDKSIALCEKIGCKYSTEAFLKDYTSFKILGGTTDDAAGECFDKTARCMGLEYPGGVTLDKIATTADLKKYPLPFPKSLGEYAGVAQQYSFHYIRNLEDK